MNLAFGRGLDQRGAKRPFAPGFVRDAVNLDIAPGRYAQKVPVCARIADRAHAGACVAAIGACWSDRASASVCSRTALRWSGWRRMASARRWRRSRPPVSAPSSCRSRARSTGPPARSPGASWRIPALHGPAGACGPCAFGRRRRAVGWHVSGGGGVGQSGRRGRRPVAGVRHHDRGRAGHRRDAA